MKQHTTLSKTEEVAIKKLLNQLRLKKKTKQEELKEVQLIINFLEKLSGFSKIVNFDLPAQEWKKDSIVSSIQKILKVSGALHVKSIFSKLIEMDIDTTFGSVKASLHSRSDKFYKVKPNTFDIIENYNQRNFTKES